MNMNIVSRQNSVKYPRHIELKIQDTLKQYVGRVNDSSTRLMVKQDIIKVLIAEGYLVDEDNFEITTYEEAVAGSVSVYTHNTISTSRIDRCKYV